jgi:hypothetical protein
MGTGVRRMTAYRLTVQARRNPAGAAPSEKAWEGGCIDLFRAAGGTVYKLSQPRRTMQSEGLPDLYVLFPRRGLGFWFEVKRPGAELRPAQQQFRELALRSGERHFWGALAAARAALQDLGILGGAG